MTFKPNIDLLIKPGPLLGLVLHSCLFLNGQFAMDRFDIEVGIACYNHFAYGGVSTLSESEYFDGFTTIPTIGLTYELNDKYSINSRFDYAWLMSKSEGGENRTEWLDNATTVFQIGLSRTFGQISPSIFLTGIDHSINRVSFFDNGSGLERWGPGLGITYEFEAYRLTIAKDILFDFATYNLSFWDEYISARLTKKISKGSEKNNSLEKNSSNTFGAFIFFGSEIIADQYSDRRLLTPSVYASFGLEYKSFGMFYKRSINVNLLSSFTNFSTYTISNNIGLLYGLDEKNTFGLSYLSDNDLLQRRAHFLEGKFIDPVYFISGFSIHYNRKITNKTFLTSQLDLITNNLVFRNNTLTDSQLRFGLSYKL